MSNAMELPSIGEADWLCARATQQVFAALNQRGHTARCVGGCVRNSLLAQLGEGDGRPAPVTDIDFATTATPEEVLELAAAAGLRTVPTGLQHGTVTVIVDGEGFEVTTLRRDVATDGRHAQVAFTDDWAIDAARRDLTINALYAEADGAIFDPLGGIGDLLDRRIRFVGDAATRIREDYLRILRFFRFYAQYGAGPPDVAGLAACVAERGGLARLSRERVQQELMKLLAAPGAIGALTLMIEHGLFGEVLPVVPNLERLARVVEQDPPPDSALRLAALGVLVAEDAARLAAGLRLSRQHAAILQLVGAAQQRQGRPDLDEVSVRRLLYRHGRDDFVRLIQFYRALYPEALSETQWQEQQQLPDRWDVPAFPITGGDLMHRGMRPGVQLGAILAELEQRWLQSDFRLERDALLLQAEKLIGEDIHKS